MDIFYEPQLKLAYHLVVVFASSSYILGLVTRKFSWVDKLWSITPIIFTALATFPHVRSLLIDGSLSVDTFRIRSALLLLSVAIWGSRLTFNFARKGGYKWSGEDYRWVIVQKWFPNIVLWEIFHLLFICIYQHILLFLISVPAFICAKSTKPLGSFDILNLVLMNGLILLETLSDEQQWKFQTEKHRKINAKVTLRGEFKQGFLSSGLFKYSRHPNFFAEISVWFVVYAIGSVATNSWINPGLIGPTLLLLLFQGSTWLTEKISSEKYPMYKEYQKVTSALIPMVPMSKMKQI